MYNTVNTYKYIQIENDNGSSRLVYGSSLTAVLQFSPHWRLCHLDTAPPLTVPCEGHELKLAFYTVSVTTGNQT